MLKRPGNTGTLFLSVGIALLKMVFLAYYFHRVMVNIHKPL